MGGRGYLTGRPLKKIYVIFSVAMLNSCVSVQLYPPSDKRITPETRELYSSMERLVRAGVLFGHHDDTGYGLNWKFDNDSSDVKSVTGTYPAIYGWDLAKIEHDSTADINKLSFALQRQRIREAYERGGINTFSWHMDNPVNGQSAWDTTTRAVAEIIPGGAANATYVKYLDKAANYLSSLKGKSGERIPVLFRPFHELTGNWFWWCKNTCTPDEFKTLWRFTIDYLRKNKKLHNLLIVYSVADFDSEAEFMERYPGDDYVDFVGFDNYCVKDIGKYEKNLDKRLTLLEQIAAKHHKLSCLAETGYLNIPQADWWTQVLLPILAKHKISYVMVWRNAGPEQYFAPYPGQQSADDFRKFSESDRLIFQNRLTPLGVYGSKPQ